MSQHTLSVQTYRVRNTWCQQQFVFNIRCAWRHCRHSVAGVVCTEYILLLDIGVTSAIVNGSIYSPLPSLWNCISFFLLLFFCLSCLLEFMEIYVTQRLDTPTLMTLFCITQESLCLCVFILVAFKRWRPTITQSELGICYVSCLYRSSLCLSKHHAMTACSGRQNYTHS